MARNSNARAAATLGCVAALLTAVVITSPRAATPRPQKTVWNGVYTEDQARRGEEIYRDKCAFCHRDALQGNGIDGGPPLRGLQFTTHWTNVKLGELANLIQVEMPADEPGTLSLQQVVDVLTFVLWANGAPAGNVELPADQAALDAILYAEKPRQPAE